MAAVGLGPGDVHRLQVSLIDSRLRDGMHTFELPVATPALTVSMLWHPRMDADPAHRWLRRWVYEVCTGSPAG